MQFIRYTKININYLLCFEQESNDLVNFDDVHQPVEDHASIPCNEFINMLLFCIDNCIWWTLIVILHNPTTEHVDASNTVQVDPEQANDEHDVPTPGKKNLCNFF